MRSLGAYNYQIPLRGQSPIQQEQMGIDPIEGAEIPFDNDPIAVREKATSDYYNTYAQLQSFLTDMSKKGLNPEAPNFAEDGSGGMAHQLYQKMVANHMFAANKLKNELAREQQIQPFLLRNQASLAPGFDPTQDFYTDDPNAVVSNEALPFVQESNLRSREKTYTQGDTQRLNQATAEQALARINDMESKGLLSPQAANIQRANIFKATQDTSYQQIVAADKAAADKERKGKSKFSVDLLKAIVNQSAGNWADGRDEIRNGKRYNISTRFAGEQIGQTQETVTDKNGNTTTRTIPIVIKEWVKGPDGKVTIKFTDPSIPDREINANSGEQLTVGIIANNQKYGGSNAIPDMFTTAGELGLLDANNNLNPSSIVTQTTPPAENQEMDVKLDKRVKDFNKFLDRASEAIQIFKLPNGKIIKVDYDNSKGRGTKGYYIYNAKALGMPEKKMMSREEILQILQDNGYFDDIVSSTPNNQSTPNQQTVDRSSAL